ncbi:hypothetical protein GCM10010282_09950 [Streptomyces roseolus]|nr:hypothetical protein GCM10010282_09950 [Streptomyces roseolus]
MLCEAGAGAGFGEGAAGAAANAPVVVTAAPMIAAVATTDMTLRLEPFKVLALSSTTWLRAVAAAREARCEVGSLPWSLGWGARAPPPAPTARVKAVTGGVSPHAPDTCRMRCGG